MPAPPRSHEAPPTATVEGVLAEVREALGQLEQQAGAHQSAGAYLDHARAWVGAAHAAPAALPPFPNALRMAAKNLPSQPVALRAARDAFTKAVGVARKQWPREAAPAAVGAPVRVAVPSRCRLDEEVRPPLARAPRRPWPRRLTGDYGPIPRGPPHLAGPPARPS